MTRPPKIILEAAAEANDLIARQQTFAEAFRTQRMHQYAIDRVDALRRLTPEAWQIFSLRWNLAPPFPKGWGDEDSQFAVMHKVRLMMATDFTEEERKVSAAWLVGHGIELPEGLTYEDGRLKGVAHGPGPIAR